MSDATESPAQDAPEGTPQAGCATSTAHWVGFLMLYPASICLMGVLIGVWAVLSDNMALVTDPAASAAPGFLGATALVQITTLALCAAGLSLFLPRARGGALTFEPSMGQLGWAHAIRAAHPGWFAVAAFATLTIGFLPGWVAEQLMELPALESMAQQLAAISEGLADPSAPGWIWLFLAVVVTAPVCEELIFRGYLWRAAETSLPPVAVWLLTSVAFACYHLNPVHVLVVLPIGLLLGFLRWWSGSIWPSMLAHFVNNSLAVILTVALSDDVEDPGLLIDTLLFAVALGIVAVGWYTIPRLPEESP